jgi:hypothetical protein
MRVENNVLARKLFEVILYLPFHNHTSHDVLADLLLILANFWDIHPFSHVHVSYKVLIEVVQSRNNLQV